MNIILHSIGCPQCIVLKRKLDAAGIDYILNTDQAKMIEMGIQSLPILQIDDTQYSFKDALTWLRERTQ